MGLIQSSKLEEGEIFNKWLENRFRRNKNVLGVQLGGTGSGKSYRDLRIAELWYQYKFNERFPVENICFGVAQAMKLIAGGKLRKGELIMFEEAGVNLGSLDFQNKVSKMMTYVLQSFRSMNIGILFNLPYLSMLNKQARMLMHYSFESMGVDHNNKLNKCKPFFHQVNQSTGKIYTKYPKINVNGKARTIKRFSYKMPSEYLVNAYEKKKAMFLSGLTEEYTMELNNMEKETLRKMERKELTDKQMKVYNLLKEGYKQTQIAKMLKKDDSSITRTIQLIKKKGYLLEFEQNTKEKRDICIQEPIPIPV